MKNKFRKFSLGCMLIINTIVITPKITYSEQVSTQINPNIPSNWAREEVNAAIEIDLVPERIQGEYKTSITREEFSEATVKLYEILSSKEAILPEENPFTDTQNKQVMIANKLGIAQGRGNEKFDPNNTITREEISVMLYRTLKVAKPQYNYSGAHEYIFSDQSMISSWAKESVAYLYSVEVINGVGDNRFNPEGDTSRQEAIVLAKRMHEKVLSSKATSVNNLIASRGGNRRQESAMKLKLEKLIPQEIGKPYQWGGVGPDSYDCSGLVYSLFGKLGISLPRTSKSQAEVGTYVPKEELTYGDLVFFARDGRNINHAGIYVGNGDFVHAPSSGDVVKITTLTSGYYANGYYTARRVLN